MDKRNTFWNAVAAMVNALEAVIIVAVVSRLNSIEEAGMVTLAFSLANLFVTIGKFGIKNYQVAHESYDVSFSIFLKLRIITVMMMLATVFCYILLNLGTYSVEKILIVAGICMWYAVEAFEDVYIGSYQVDGRLDVGSKIFIVRWCTILSAFVIVDILWRDTVIAVGCAFFLSLLVEIVLLVFTNKRYPRKQNNSKIGLSSLFREGIPLFVSGFVYFYMTNIPKYAIDSYQSDSVQAIYGYVSMPVFVISLLNSIIYQPQLMYYVKEFRDGKLEAFTHRICRQIVVIVGILLIVLLGAWILGIQFLSILYHQNLYDYKMHMMLLLIGGAFLAVGGFLSTMLTLMDLQKKNMLVYLFTVTIGTIIVFPLVKKFELEGAVLGYLMTMLVMVVAFSAVVFLEIKGSKVK